MALRKVAVIGGSGFIGRQVVRRLAKTGAQIVVAARDAERAKLLKPMGDVGQIAAIPVDLASDADMARALAGAEAVVNLVGILAERGRQRFDALQHQGAARAARIAQAEGARRLVQLSAIGADPEDALAYPRTKGLGEVAVLAAFPTATILRPSIVFGPDDGFFNLWARMASLSPVLPLFGGGVSRFQPVYVGDVADAVMAALGADGAACGKTYELGGPRVMTLRQILELVLAETRRRRLLLPIPFTVAETMGRIAQRLPMAPATEEQMLLLKRDNVCSGALPGLAELGIRPTAVEAVLPTYLDRYRPKGRFTPRPA